MRSSWQCPSYPGGGNSQAVTPAHAMTVIPVLANAVTGVTALARTRLGRPRSPRSPSKPLEPSKPPEPPEPLIAPSSRLLGAAQSSTNCFHRCPIVRARYVCEYKLCIDDGEDVWPILRPLWVAGNRSFPVKNDLLTPGRDRCHGYNKHLVISVFDDNEKPLWRAAAFENDEFFVRFCTPPCAEVWPP